MKAFILAAGFGTRLHPHTESLPKPLFTIINKPLIRGIIDLLFHYGFTEIFINTHHLHKKIENYIQNAALPECVHLEYEKDIQNTGGGIKNISKRIGNEPFLIINSDIITDIDFKAVYNTHISGNHKVTMVLCKNRFNNVKIEKNFVSSISDNFSEEAYTFTGIQVVSPEVIPYFEKRKSSIEAYKKMIKDGIKIHSFIMDENIKWDDLGTIESIEKNNIKAMIEEIDGSKICSIKKIDGDGSDRLWSRITTKKKTYICVNHKIMTPSGAPEANSFFKIAKHLKWKRINVPELYAYDLLSGIGILEDLGEERMQDFILSEKKTAEKLKLCKKVINKLFDFSIKGKIKFTDDMSWQTPTYSKEVSINECIYFKEEFLMNLNGLKLDEKQLDQSFHYIADNAIKYPMMGLMHRDFQSRNIMIKNEEPFFIDFQGARKGPLQYDLASFIIDPYVNFSEEFKTELLSFTLKKIKEYNFSEKEFLHSYRFCALARNMQILGAFSYLSLKKKKVYFKQYIPTALKTLKELLSGMQANELTPLKKITNKI